MYLTDILMSIKMIIIIITMEISNARTNSAGMHRCIDSCEESTVIPQESLSVSDVAWTACIRPDLRYRPGPAKNQTTIEIPASDRFDLTS